MKSDKFFLDFYFEGYTLAGNLMRCKGEYPLFSIAYAKTL